MSGGKTGKSGVIGPQGPLSTNLLSWCSCSGLSMSVWTRLRKDLRNSPSYAIIYLAFPAHDAPFDAVNNQYHPMSSQAQLSLSFLSTSETFLDVISCGSLPPEPSFLTVSEVFGRFDCAPWHSSEVALTVKTTTFRFRSLQQQSRRIDRKVLMVTKHTICLVNVEVTL
jgi:hypothetical protein